MPDLFPFVFREREPSDDNYRPDFTGWVACAQCGWYGPDGDTIWTDNEKQECEGEHPDASLSCPQCHSSYLRDAFRPVAVVTIPPQLVVGNRALLRETVTRLLADGARDIVFDFRASVHVDSTGIGVLVGSNKRIREAGGRLALRGADRSDLLRTLKLIRLDEMFALEEEVGLPIQGVVFVLRDGQGRILMERCPKKAARHGAEWFIPGGRIEGGETPAAALFREMREELSCTPQSYSALPIIDACGGPGWPSFLMQPYLVTLWSGTVPTHTLDHPDVPLRWMAPVEAIHSASAVVRALIAAAVPAIGWRTAQAMGDAHA